MTTNHTLNALGYVLIGLFALQSAAAQDTTAATVNAGKNQEILTSTQPITLPDPKSPLRGSVQVLSTQGTPPGFALFYRAPATLSVFTETITYANPVEKTVSVTFVPQRREPANCDVGTETMAAGGIVDIALKL